MHLTQKSAPDSLPCNTGGGGGGGGGAPPPLSQILMPKLWPGMLQRWGADGYTVCTGRLRSGPPMISYLFERA
jgi:hypothetical protein